MEHLLKAFQPAAEVSPESSVGVPDSDPDDDTDPEARPLRPPSPAAYRPVVAFSIHQPSEAIFRMFDQLMLFAQGHVLYHGPAGQALPHFAGVGHAFPAGANPADWLLYLCTDAAMLPPRARGADAAEAEELAISGDLGRPGAGRPPAVPGALTGVVATPPVLGPASILRDFEESMRYYPEFMEQLPVLTWRVFLSMKRNPLLLKAHFVVTVILGLFVGILYQSFDDCAIQPHDQPCAPDMAGIWNRAGAFFFLLMFLSLGSMSVIDAFQSERVLFARERASGYYGTGAYLLPKLLLDFVPLRVVPALVLGLLIYTQHHHKFDWGRWEFTLFHHKFELDLQWEQVFGMGLRPGFTHFTWFLTVLSLLNVCASAMCITISTICPTFGLAALVSTLYLLFLMAFGGVYIRMDSMPESLHWLRYVSFFSSAFELLMVNEINGRTVLFNPVDANGQHQYSVPQTGRTFLYNMGLVPTEAQWKLDMLLLLLLTALYVLLAGLFLHFGNQERR